MMSERQRCICGNSVAVVVAALLGACQPKPPQQEMAAQPGAIAAKDQQLIDRAEKLRARAEAVPGGATEAGDFASAVTAVYTQGAARRQKLSSELLDAAIVCLARARQAKGDDDPDLIVRKGELLVAAGQQARGVSALRESIALRPTLRGFQALGKIYAAETKLDEVTALCKRTLPAMKSDESRYAVLENCLEFSGASAPEVGLGWASPKDLAFYKSRRHQLEARQDAAKQKAKDTPEAAESR